MRYEGSTEIVAHVTDVWNALVDPHQMSTCMPGLVTWHEVKENKIFQLMVSWGMDNTPQVNIPIRIIWESLNASKSMVIVGETAVNQLPIHTKATITLTPIETAITTLAFKAEITTPNRMMDRLVHTAVPPLIAKFFKCLKHTIENS